MTGRVGLIGWPVAHSLSPAMHAAAFAALGLDWRYELLPVAPDQVAQAAARLRDEGWAGANVTVPHKRAILPCLDELSEAAQAAGAVNTIVVRGGRLVGHNTDVEGFCRALSSADLLPLSGAAAVAGAGGAARAAVAGLLRLGARQVWLLSRSAEQAETLARDLGGSAGAARRVRLLPLDPDGLAEAARTAGLLVNATPVGMWPHTGASIWPDGLPLPAHLAVFDLVYNPAETRLLRQARAAGARPVGGLEMLVQQGALAFELWTGQPAPAAAMRDAAARALPRE